MWTLGARACVFCVHTRHGATNYNSSRYSCVVNWCACHGGATASQLTYMALYRKNVPSSSCLSLSRFDLEIKYGHRVPCNRRNRQGATGTRKRVRRCSGCISTMNLSSLVVVFRNATYLGTKSDFPCYWPNGRSNCRIVTFRPIQSQWTTLFCAGSYLTFERKPVQKTESRTQLNLLLIVLWRIVSYRQMSELGEMLV